MKKITLIIAGFLLLAFMTVRLPAQTAQVSQVANLNQQNTPVVSNNFQILQSGLNGVVGLFSQYFVNGYLSTKYGGTGTDSSNWTAGDLVYMSSTGVWSHKADTQNIQFFTSSGTFTAPNGTVRVYLTGCAGGGGGGGGNGSNAGGGGGAGGCIVDYPYPVTGGNNYTVTINSGGAGGASTSPGSTGGTSVFDALTILGGSGGASANTTNNAGGLGSSQDGSNSGAAGSVGIRTGNGGNSNTTQGGGGGSSLFGIGGAGTISGAGLNATGYGAGGGGGGDTGNSGGNGSNGIIIVQY